MEDGEPAIKRDRPVHSSDMAAEVDREVADLENTGGDYAPPEVVEDLVGFLTPTTRLDVRREALDIVLGLSAPLDGSAERCFAGHDFKLGKALCKLCVDSRADRRQTMTGICNFASVSTVVADFVLQRATDVIKIAFDSALATADCGEYGARLLANCSRVFPGETHLRLLAIDAKCLEKLVDRCSSHVGQQLSTTLSYTLINLATVSRVRKELSRRREDLEGKSLLHKLYPVLQQSSDEERRRIAADVCRNCTFDDSVHADLLDDSDDFLVALLTPIADAEDNLDSEETDKLPTRLQFFEGTRTTDANLRLRVVESLYQLCATRHGRERLRARGVYALAREFDRAMQRERGGADGGAGAMIGRDFTSERPPEAHKVDAPLHNLIGVLIRYEDEMGVDPGLETIRELQ